MNPSIYQAPLSDTAVDDIVNQDGVLENMPTLDLNLPDTYIIQTLKGRIEKSASYWEDNAGYNLRDQRIKNLKAIKGDPIRMNQLYYDEAQWVDNEVYVSVDASLSYATASNPAAEVYPAGPKPEDKQVATDLEKYMEAHSKKFKLNKKFESAVLNLLGQHVGVLKLHWDPNYGKNGEIIPESVNPSHLIIDHNAKLGENPSFICHVLKDSLEGLIAKFPDKEKELMTMFSIKRKGTQNISKEIAYREVWFTYYDDDNKPQEAVAWYVNQLVLDKMRNPNWLYEGEGENFLDMPAKPFIFINLFNDGEHLIDHTGPVDQGIPMQNTLNIDGQQINDNLQTANGGRVVDSNVMTADAAQNWDNQPNQTVLVDLPAGDNINNHVAQLPPHVVSAELIADKTDSRNVLHGIMATPSQFVGTDDDVDMTASESNMIKNQASGRQDRLVRAIDDAADEYFNQLAQFILVYYTEDHLRTVNGGDGNFDHIIMHQKKIDPNMTVLVRAGTSLAFDKARQEAVAQNAGKLGILAPYDYYRLMHMDNPQKLYDNFVKWKTDPKSLAQDVGYDQQDMDAIMDFAELMNGDDPEQREDTTYAYIEQFRKKMISDEFLNAKSAIQKKVIQFVNKALDNIELRATLDNISSQEESAPVQPEPLPAPVQATIPPMPPAAPPVPPMPGAPMPPAPGVPQGPVAPAGLPPAPQQSPVQPPQAPPQFGGGGMLPSQGGIQGILQAAGGAPAPNLSPDVQPTMPNNITSL